MYHITSQISTITKILKLQVHVTVIGMSSAVMKSKHQGTKGLLN